MRLLLRSFPNACNYGSFQTVSFCDLLKVNCGETRTSISTCAIRNFYLGYDYKQISNSFQGPGKPTVVLNLSALFCLYEDFRYSSSVNESIRKHAKDLR